MAPTPLVESVYPEARFGGFSRVDGTVAFYTRVRALLGPGDAVLDVRCGRGKSEDDPSPTRRALQTHHGDAARVVGIDVDPRAAANPKVDEFRLIEDADRWPVDDRSADLVLADYVLEHVADPDAFLAEVVRVLQPGGASAPGRPTGSATWPSWPRPCPTVSTRAWSGRPRARARSTTCSRRTTA